MKLYGVRDIETGDLTFITEQEACIKIIDRATKITMGKLKGLNKQLAKAKRSDEKERINEEIKFERQLWWDYTQPFFSNQPSLALTEFIKRQINNNKGD